MPPSDEILDRQALFERVSDDREVLAAIIRIFHEQVPPMLANLRARTRADDAAGVRTAAHYFKSSIGNFSSGSAYELVGRLEQMGEQGDLTGAESTLAELEKAVASLRTSLDNLLQECR